MLQKLINWFTKNFTREAKTPLKYMQECLADADMHYLQALQDQEYYACRAEQEAVAAKYNMIRRIRLTKFIEQENARKAQQEADKEGFLEVAIMYENMLDGVGAMLAEMAKDAEAAKKAQQKAQPEENKDVKP